MQLRKFIWCLLALAWCPQPALSDVTITGAKGDLADVLEGYLEAELENCPAPSVRPEAARRRYDQAVRKGLDAMGYFNAIYRITSPADDPCQLEVEVTPNARSRIDSWQITATEPGQLDATDVEWLDALTSDKSDFRPQRYETQKRQTLATLKDRGYIDAAFDTASVEVDAETNTAAIDWVLDSGPRYRVSAIDVEQDTLDDALFRNYLDLNPGDYLVAEKVVSSYENVIASNYFSRVRVTPLLEQRTDGTVPVRVTADRAPPWSVLGGFGFATDSGPRVRGEADARYLNRSGHRANFSALLSPVLGYTKAQYRWPYGDPKHQWYTLEASVNYEDTDTAKSDSLNLGLRRSTRLTRRWTQTTYTEYITEQFDVSAQEGHSQLLLLGTNFTFTSAIDTPRPRRGSYLSFDVRGAHSAIISDNDVLQVRASAKQILPFFGRSRLLFRGQAGATWQADFDDLPVSLRFFAGGDNSVRGYSLDELGPEDETGRVVGGERLLVGSVEFDVPVRENWSMALFTDVGSAFNATPEFTQSVGVGVRWYSPLGPVRVDLAHGLDDAAQTVRLHVSLGPDI